MAHDISLSLRELFAGKKILVTGACGTIGSELVRLLVDEYGVEELIGIDNHETDLFFLDHSWTDRPQTHFYLTDVRDRDALSRRMRGIDIVFHTAAFKHVIFCEKSPYESVQTNITGVQNIISAAFDNSVERVIFTSSDKAVNPTSVMGTSKLMGERLITASNYRSQESNMTLSSTRFGNVLGSNGSVIPVFAEQIKKGGPVTLTDDEMTRFIMSTSQAVRLVIESAYLACGGEVFITKMPVIRILDLAQVMIEELAPVYGYTPTNIEIIRIGAKPGEKLYEELMSDEETRRSVELPDYFCVLPAFRDVYKKIGYEYPDVVSDNVTNPYVSSAESPLSQDQLRAFLGEHRLLDETTSDRQLDERHWPGDKG